MSDNQSNEATEVDEAVEEVDQDQTNSEVEETLDSDQTSDDTETVDAPEPTQRERGLKNTSYRQELRKRNKENLQLRQEKKEAEEKAARVEALEAVNTRYETLAENDLPLKLAKWIDATDPDDILEQAEELLSLSGGSTPPPSDTPKERVRKNRKQVTNTYEIGDLDEFAAKIFNN